MQLQKKFGHIVRQHTFIMVTRKVSMVQKVGSQATSKCQLKYYSDDLCHPKASFNDGASRVARQQLMSQQFIQNKYIVYSIGLPPMSNSNVLLFLLYSIDLLKRLTETSYSKVTQNLLKT